MAKKKTGKKAAPKDRPSGAPSQSSASPASVAPVSQARQVSSPQSVAPSSGNPGSVAPATRESRPPAPSSSSVPAEAPVVVKVPASDPRIEAAAPLRVEPAPPKEPASTAPVVKDIDGEEESPEPPAVEAAKKAPTIVAPPAAAEKKPSEPPASGAAKTDPAKPAKADDATSKSNETATAKPVSAKDEAEETAPVSARGSGSTEDAAPPSKPSDAPASTASPSSASKKADDDAPPSSRAPESRSEDKISGKALLDDRLAPKSSGKKKKKSKDKSAARESEAPESTSGVSAEANDDGHDDFFDAPAEKVSQKLYVAEAFEDEEPRFRPLTADDVVRRDKLRRIVTIVVGTAAAACLFVGVRLSMGTKHADPPPLDKSQVVIAAPPVPKPQIEVDDPKPIPSPDSTAPAASGSAAPAASGSAAPAASASAAPVASAAPSASAAPDGAAPGAPMDPAEYKKLAKNALKALDSGNNKVAVERSSAVVDADPSDATGYLYWGTALMNMGKLADAKKVFQTCVDKATKGPKGDCRQFR